MCLVLVARDTHPDFPLVLAANRDEFYDRPTLPAAPWAEAPWITGGRDLRAGGTWLGVDRAGRFAAVTNYRQGTREPEASRSRGHLVSEFLIGGTAPHRYLHRVAAEAGRYNGFNLLVGDSSELGYFSNREGRLRMLEPGVYGLSNHLLDTDWPKVRASKGALRTALAEDGEPTERLFAMLADRSRFADHLLPSTGVSPEWERLLSSAFIVSEEYGTRSSTVLLVGRDGRIVFVERSYGPGGAAGAEVQFEFARESARA